MKIAAIHPSVYMQPIEEAYQARVAPGNELKLMCATDGVFNTAGDVDLKGYEAALLARQAEKDGYDAAIVCGGCDFSLAVVRGAVDIPVVGPASATFNLVYQLAQRFGVISVSSKWSPSFHRAIRECGCTERMTSMRALPKPMGVNRTGIEIPYTPEELEAQILEVARAQVEEEDAQCIVVQCAPTFATMLPAGAQQRLSDALGGVLFPDMMAIAIGTAEMLVNVGLSHSKLEYPRIESASLEDRYEAEDSEIRRIA
jgi:allantoin racemase